MSMVDRLVRSSPGRVKPDYKIGMYVLLFLSKTRSFKERKSKYWLNRTQYTVSKWSDMSTQGLLFQWASTEKIQLSVLV